MRRSVIILQIMSFSSFRCPATTVEDKPNKKLTFAWRPCFLQASGTTNFSLADEERAVS